MNQTYAPTLGKVRSWDAALHHNGGSRTAAKAESTVVRPLDRCDAANSNSELFQDLGIPASDLQPDRVAMVF